MNDRRTRAWRDSEVLDVIRNCGGVSPAWLRANRSRLAALRRLADAGKIRGLDDASPEFHRFEVVEPEPPTLWERFKAWVVGGVSV